MFCTHAFTCRQILLNLLECQWQNSIYPSYLKIVVLELGTKSNEMKYLWVFDWIFDIVCVYIFQHLSTVVVSTVPIVTIIIIVTFVSCIMISFIWFMLCDIHAILMGMEFRKYTGKFDVFQWIMIQFSVFKLTWFIILQKMIWTDLAWNFDWTCQGIFKGKQWNINL